MKTFTTLFLIAILLSAGCKNETVIQNRFSSEADTLVLKTEKVKGVSLIPGAYYGLSFGDTVAEEDFRIIYPADIDDIRIAHERVDFKLFTNNNVYGNRGQAVVPTVSENTISFLKGSKDGRQVFIVDENNNKDFTDDPVRPDRSFEYKRDSDLICCRYGIFNGAGTVHDSGWINVGTSEFYGFTFAVAHHHESRFTLDDHTYSIDIINGMPFCRFCFENPEVAIIEEDGIRKDSLLNDDIIKRGEYLKLRDNYYLLAGIANDGSSITFVKEKDISDKISTHTGFLAPDFSCKTTSGDTLRLSDFKGKYLLLANVSACWSPKSSYQCFNELSQAYGSVINIIGIDNSPVFLEQIKKKLKLEGQFTIADENKAIKASYRKDYCSRTCFLIAPDGHIADNFEIFDWEQALKKHRLKNR